MKNHGRITQLVEFRSHKPRVTGSSPVAPTTTEKWKSVEGSDYEVSSIGRVRSLKSQFYGRVLKPRQNSRGYLYVNLCHDGKYKSKSVHVLVARAFLRGVSKDGVNHKDGNKLNNCAYNLEWATHAENVRHAENRSWR